MGDFIRAIGEGIGGLLGGSIAALGTAFDSVVATLQVWLPGPLLPAVVIVVVVLFVRWLFTK